MSDQDFPFDRDRKEYDTRRPQRHGPPRMGLSDKDWMALIAKLGVSSFRKSLMGLKFGVEGE